MDPISQQNLKQFIFEASRATYDSGDPLVKQKEEDGSTSIRFQKKGYKYHNNFFGGEPFGGREVVFLKNKPIWMMVYYGTASPEAEPQEVYSFLKKALSHSTVDMPYRGLADFKVGRWRYENSLVGDVEKLSGTEKIFKDDMCVYEANYFGGLIDHR